MTTITKESLSENIDRLESKQSDPWLSLSVDENYQLEAYRMLLASMDSAQEPVYQYQSGIFNDENGETDWYWDDCDAGFYSQYAEDRRRILYAAPQPPTDAERSELEVLKAKLKAAQAHITEIEAAAPAPVGPGEEAVAVMPDFPGRVMTQRECWQAGKESGLAEARNSPVIPYGWVACSERMPEEDGNYWGWWSESRRQGPVWFIKSELQAQFQSAEITHWMPMPAAPQQEVK